MPQTDPGGHAPDSAGLNDTTDFVYLMPPGGPYHLPAVFESANGDAQVFVKVTQYENIVDVNNQNTLTIMVWPFARQMALDLYTKCRTARLGRVGESTLEYHLDSGMYMTMQVGFMAKYAAPGQGVSFYSAGGGPGPPQFVHH